MAIGMICLVSLMVKPRFEGPVTSVQLGDQAPRVRLTYIARDRPILDTREPKNGSLRTVQGQVRAKRRTYFK